MRIALYESAKDPTPTTVDIEWSDLCELLEDCLYTFCGEGDCAPCPGSSCLAKHGRAWSPVDIEGRRANDNVRAITVAVFDLDHLNESQLLQVADRLEGWQHIVHATHSDMPGNRCLRVVIPLSRPVLPHEWPQVRSGAVSLLGLPADPATKDLARLYFLPSRPSGYDYLYAHGEGMCIDVGKLLLPQVDPKNIANRSVETFEFETGAKSNSLTERVINHAREWLKFHGPAVQGENGDKHTYIVGTYLLHDLALEWSDAFILAEAWNETCVPPWSKEELEQKLRNGEKYAEGVKGSKRTDIMFGAALKEMMPTSPVERLRQAMKEHEPVNTDGLYGQDLREFLGEDEPGDDDDWLVKGVIAAGVPQVIAGVPKSKKTFVAEHLAICIAGGIKWLNEFDTKQGRVLLLPKEDSVRETRRRIWRLTRGLGLDPRDLHEWLRIDAVQSFYFDKDDDLKRMIATLETWKPSLVIIDSLSRTHVGDENSVREMLPVTKAWAELCQGLNVAIAIIHHLRKSSHEDEGKPFGLRLRGTGDLHAMVRHVVGVEKKDKDIIAITTEGNFGNLPEPFTVNMLDDIDGYGKKNIKFLYNGHQKYYDEQEIRNQVFEYLMSQAPTPIGKTSLHKACKGGYYKVDKQIAELVKEGKILMTDNLRYYIPVEHLS